MGLVSGTRVALEETYCRRMLDEEIPAAVPAADAVPVLRARREVEPSRPLAFLGVPLQLSTGRVYGTLCAASKEPRGELRDRDVAFDVADVPEPERGQIGGWGLHIMRQVSRGWDV